MNKDMRIPTSVHHCGRVTVYIFDEEAYRANIAEYYPGTAESSTPATTPRKRYTSSYPKPKGIARYNWAGTRVKTEQQRGVA